MDVAQLPSLPSLRLKEDTSTTDATFYVMLVSCHREGGWRGALLKDFGGDVVLVLVKVLGEQTSELGLRRRKLLLVLPRRAGLQDVGRHIAARGGVAEAEDGVNLVLRLGKRAVMDRINDGAGVLERASLAL